MTEPDDTLSSSTELPAEQPAPRPKAPPIDSRFLFVDVAAMRAKQLRRGALPRLDYNSEDRVRPFKAERVAMEEVKRGLVQYEVPEKTTAPRA
jgi:DNA-directed RNA polymerase subunit K/omega